MAVSILFLSLWGRAVVVDTDTLAESLSPLAGSSTVVGYLADWMADEMVESGADPDVVEPAIDYYFESSSTAQTLDQFATEVVYASASTNPSGSTIDMAALIYPAVPELTLGLTELGYPVTESGVSEVVRQLDPLVIRAPGSEAMVGPASPTAARLGTAALLALLAIVGFGSFYIAFSEDRITAIRSLLTRVAVGGLSFAVFLRVGSWVLDPDGGRAPVRESLSSLAGSKWAVPLQVAAVAAVIAGAIYVGRRTLRRAGVFPSPDDLSTPSPERRESLSGSR
jgi:hypothetical protein